jgi:Na+-driven multidrug efflux pump
VPRARRPFGHGGVGDRPLVKLNVAINLVAIPRRGGAGAAWATAITEAALTLCCLVALAPHQ